MLKVENLHAYYGKSHVLHGVNFEVGQGEIVALLGRNGSGRSTTAKAIMGLVDCQGSIDWSGQAIQGKKAYEVAHLGIGYVPENRDIFPKLTVYQNLQLGQKGGAKNSRWSFDDMYAMFPRLKEREHTEAGVLSGGEQQMLTLCRTLMGDSDHHRRTHRRTGAQDRRAGGGVPQAAQAAGHFGPADRAEADDCHEHLGPRPGHGPRQHRVRGDTRRTARKHLHPQGMARGLKDRHLRDFPDVCPLAEFLACGKNERSFFFLILHPKEPQHDS
mgnify:CR=1 FL=1